MLKETETEEAAVFFVTLLPLIAFHLGGGEGGPPAPPPPPLATSMPLVGLKQLKRPFDQLNYTII